MIDSKQAVLLIKKEAARLGFDACGIAAAGGVAETDRTHLSEWLEAGYAAEMNYMHNHFEKRIDPRELVEGARSLVMVALNYYPSAFRKEHDPQFAYYAYGKDYHDVIKEKLKSLFEYINTHIAPVTGRIFTDSAPVLDRYWAVQAGLGFIGKNGNLIIPGKGSYFFIGELIIDLQLPADSPVKGSCGSCTRCLDACPPKALRGARKLDARRCISYQTIENRGEIDPAVVSVLNNRVYGCDICQQVCPWNRFASPHATPELQPTEEFLALDREGLEKMTPEEFSRIFKGSAVKRAGFKGLRRNVEALGKGE